MLKLGNVGISNFDDTTRVNFAIQTYQHDWTSEYLDPRDTREFACDTLENKGCMFWMQTGDKPPVVYAIDDARYAIIWDQQAGIWDLRKVGQSSDPN